jgi:glycosyltransferase involved in cell wall biosynthesis
MKSQPKILVLLLNNFSNDSRVLKECTTLVQNGYSVELWALYDPALPDHEVVGGFVVRRKLMTKEKKLQAWKKRVKSLRQTLLYVPLKVLKGNRFLYSVSKRSFNALENRAMGLARSRASKQRKRNLADDAVSPKGFDFDLIHCNDLHALELGVNMKRQHPQVRIVYDSHEHQTETPKLKAASPEKKRAQELERECVALADEVITVSEPIADEYEKMYGISKVHVVKNCPPLLDKRPISTDHFRKVFKLSKNDLVFLYQGQLKESRGVGEILECFSLLWKNGIRDKHMVFMGYGPLEKEIQKVAKECRIVHFHPAVKMDELPKVSGSADYGVIFIPNNCKSYFYSLPNKLFEHIAAGLPIIASPLQSMKELIEREKVGLVTRGFSAEDLYKEIEGISSPPKESLRRSLWELHQRKYNWEIEEKKLLAVYEAVS